MKKFDFSWGNTSGLFDEPPVADRNSDDFEIKRKKVAGKRKLNELKDQFNAFLTEDGFVGPDELPDDVAIEVSFTPQDAGMIILVDEHGQKLDSKHGDPIFGQMWLSHSPECGGYSIQFVKATHGFGPLLYDIAMELMDMNDSWLVPDRTSVTEAAQDVWEYYDQKRRDGFEKEPIDLEADCSFRAAIKAVKIHQDNGGKIYDDWEKHPLAFRWRKTDHWVTDGLKAAGKLRMTGYRDKLREQMTAKFSNKFDQVLFQMPLKEDEFVHFTTAPRAKEIIESGKLLLKPPYDKFGTDTVDAVSLTYGLFLPGVQTTHITNREGQIVGVKFKTNTLPDIGFVEEVKWRQDVELIDPKIITIDRAKSLLDRAPEYKRVDKLDWGFVTYTEK